MPTSPDHKNTDHVKKTTVSKENNYSYEFTDLSIITHTVTLLLQPHGSTCPKDNEFLLGKYWPV